WLSDAEKARLRQQLGHDTHAPVQGYGHLWGLVRNPMVWVLSFIYFLLVAGTYAITFWMPTLIKSWGIADLFMIGVYAAVPNLFAIVGIVLLARSSDRRNERRWHFMAAALMAAAGLGITALTQGQFAASLAGLCVALVGITAVVPIFFALTSEVLPRAGV